MLTDNNGENIPKKKKEVKFAHDSENIEIPAAPPKAPEDSDDEDMVLKNIKDK